MAAGGCNEILGGGDEGNLPPGHYVKLQIMVAKGALAVVRKPFDLGDLCEAIDGVLGKQT